MTQELYQKAIKFAGVKHSDQNVPGTESNYLLHLSNVAMEIILAHNFSNDFDLDYAVQVALLHDTLEDTKTEFDEIKEIFGKKIADGVLALTKDPNISSKKEMMLDSLNRISTLQDEVAIVKLADRITNLQEPPKHWDREKVKDYLEESKLMSEALSDKNTHLNNRLASKIEDYKKYAGQLRFSITE